MMRISGSTRWCRRERKCGSRRRKKRPPRKAATSSFGLELLHAFEKNVASDRKTFGADFVERVLGGVPVGNFEVNYINGRHVALDEGFVVVEDFRGILNKCAGIA